MKTAVLGVLGAVAVLAASAQTAEPAAPKPQASAQAAVAAAAAAKNPFPPVNPKNFTAATPTPADVNSFLKELWGYDENRTWSVVGIQKTPAPGVAKVTVMIADKAQPGKEASTVFYVTPDGKHALAGEVIDFGAQPFAEKKATLLAEAKGPSRGAKGDGLLLVEFADLQCPHCKEAQDTMDQLATDFPQARIVFENYPITEIHPYAEEAAAMGVCVRKAKGDPAFFTYASAVFEAQAALTASNHEGALATAVTRAGADAKVVAACAATPATIAEVNAERKLGEDLGVNQTPTLMVNGWALPVASVPYEVLKKMIAYRAGLDGVTVHLQPTLTELK
ncbi:MAG: thioredoxin domain-containing protein [Acidobacteriaceae bacterium]|nr:thioredoxin domain-containing protein [Acidobacteriaceae bacterium]